MKGRSRRRRGRDSETELDEDGARPMWYFLLVRRQERIPQPQHIVRPHPREIIGDLEAMSGRVGGRHLRYGTHLGPERLRGAQLRCDGCLRG